MVDLLDVTGLCFFLQHVLQELCVQKPKDRIPFQHIIMQSSAPEPHLHPTCLFTIISLGAAKSICK